MSKSKEVAQTVAPVELKYDPSRLAGTKSSQIRYLDSCGLKRGEIAKVLGIRYQWVRNVLITPLKKQG
jgi:hypothetical protein